MLAQNIFKLPIRFFEQEEDDVPKSHVHELLRIEFLSKPSALLFALEFSLLSFFLLIAFVG